MKKNRTRILMLVLVTVLSMSLLLGLTGCGAAGPEAFASAQSAWNSSNSKSATDEVKLSFTLDLGDIGSNVKIDIEFVIEREYGADGELLSIDGSLDKVMISNLADGLVGTINTLLGMLEVNMPPDIDINDILSGDSITLTNVATGSITLEDDEYIIEGGLSIPMFGLSINTDDDDQEPIAIKVADIERAMEDLDLEVSYDMLSLYNIESSAVSKKNVATVTGESALNYLLNQAFDLYDTLMDGDLVFDSEEVVAPEDIQTVLTELIGSATSSAIRDFLIGSSGLLDLGDVTMDVAYEGENFKTISTSHTLELAIEKSFIVEDVLGADFMGDSLDEIGGIITFAMGMLPETLTVELVISVETTLEY